MSTHTTSSQITSQISTPADGLVTRSAARTPAARSPIVHLGDDIITGGTFHQGQQSLIGDEWFGLSLCDGEYRNVATLILSPHAVVRLAAELDKLRADAELLLDQAEPQ